MKREGDSLGDGEGTRRGSIRNRVIAGFAAIVIAFGGLILYSIYVYRQTVTELALINTTYLPLTLGTSDVRATQLVFNTLMDRLADDPNPAVTRDWIDAARRYRPATLRRLSRVIRETLESDIPGNEEVFLKELQRRIEEVRERYSDNEARFNRLYAEMDAGHREASVVQIEKLKRAERLLDKVLAGIEEELNRHITKVAEEAEANGMRALGALGILTVGALLLGLGIAFSIHRRLAPLRTLQEAVASVARGEVGTHLEVGSQDEIGNLADGFNRMTAALAERDKMLIRSERLATAGKMAAQVTHEIRNPLSSLGLNADLLEDEIGKGDDAAEARSLLSAMQDEIERLTGITESYLRFARLPAPDPELGDLNDMVEASLDFMRGEFEEKGIALETDLADLGEILFDRGQLRQALTNLLRNAREAVGESGKVIVRTRRDEETALLEVADDGPGIPDEVADQIFDSFYTTKSGGTGLGLAMVRQICLAHGGEITHAGAEAGGSVFTMALPAAPLGVDGEDRRSDG